MPTDILDPAVARTAIVAAVQAVVGAGKVYPYRRMVMNDAAVATLMTDGSKINAWMLSFALNNTALSERHMGFNAIGVPGGGMVVTTFTFQIDGYFSVNDAADSEEAFETLAWGICQAINSYGKLNVNGLVQQGPCQLQQCTYAMLANKYFTHYAKLLLTMMGRTQ